MYNVSFYFSLILNWDPSLPPGGLNCCGPMGPTPNWLQAGTGGLLNGAQDPGDWNGGADAEFEDPIEDYKVKYKAHYKPRYIITIK